MTAVTAYVALGSNLGDREDMIGSAVRALDATPAITTATLSTVRETSPVGPPGQGTFLNAVVEVTTSLDPRPLLEACLAIELKHGRRRTEEERWGPRRLDLDLLLYGDRVIDEPGLTVPHPRLHERSFVLEPLAEIAGGVVHPVLGLSVESLWKTLAADEGEPETRSPRSPRKPRTPWNPTCDGTLPAQSS